MNASEIAICHAWGGMFVLNGGVCVCVCGGGGGWLLVQNFSQ